MGIGDIKVWFYVVPFSLLEKPIPVNLFDIYGDTLQQTLVSRVNNMFESPGTVGKHAIRF